MRHHPSIPSRRPPQVFPQKEEIPFVLLANGISIADITQYSAIPRSYVYSLGADVTVQIRYQSEERIFFYVFITANPSSKIPLISLFERLKKREAEKRARTSAQYVSRWTLSDGGTTIHSTGSRRSTAVDEFTKLTVEEVHQLVASELENLQLDKKT